MRTVECSVPTRGYDYTFERWASVFYLFLSPLQVSSVRVKLAGTYAVTIKNYCRARKLYQVTL